MEFVKCITLILLFMILSCGLSNQTDSNSTAKVDPIVAVTFINEYTKYRNGRNSEEKILNWIKDHKLLTPKFKKEYKNLIVTARKVDPELGLDFDPIFDGQDFPDVGFSLLNHDGNGYVTVQGVDWPEFKLVIKLVTINNQSLVDGSGVINVPEVKRINRF